MDKPTLQEVKEYFKNAKEVLCLWNRKKYDISDFNIFYNELYKSYYASKNKKDIEGSNDSYVCLFGRNQYEKYAEIISYKEPLYQLTAKEIRNAYENPEYLKDQFKECFETELFIGKYFSSDLDYFKSTICITEIQQRDGYRKVYYYGIVNGEFRSNYFANKGIENNLKPATEKEVEEALVKEAIKRGYEEGVTIKNHQGTFVLNELNFVLSDGKYNDGIWTRQGNGVWIFFNGVWSDIITPTYTIPEAESKFNIKIKAV